MSETEESEIATTTDPIKTRGPSRRKKAASRKSRTTAAKSRQQIAQQARFPRHSVDRALRIPRAIYEQNGGNPCSAKEAASFTGAASVSGPFRVEISSANKYGFLRSEGGTLILEPRARQAIAPQSETDRIVALRDAVLAAPDLGAVYNFYRGENLPDTQFFTNALTDRFEIPADKIIEFLQIFNDSIQAAELVDETGDRPQLIDVGRDEAHRDPPNRPHFALAVASDTSCFVMQPFGGTLGSYYDTIFRPAIEQAGLAAVRADAEIFGTGKIMDQIWRGIRESRILVAELTNKNPNVFYELGLAMRLKSLSSSSLRIKRTFRLTFVISGSSSTTKRIRSGVRS